MFVFLLALLYCLEGALFIHKVRVSFIIILLFKIELKIYYFLKLLISILKMYFSARKFFNLNILKQYFMYHVELLWRLVKFELCNSW